MGDRANILVVDEKKDGAVTGGIYLYTHWSGSEWPEELRVALHHSRSRWGDEPYCTRRLISILFSDIHDSETGGGVSTWMGDNSHPIVICDQTEQIVAFAKPGHEQDSSQWVHRMSFEMFVAQDAATYPEEI